MADATRTSQAGHPRLPAQPSNQPPRWPAIPRSWVGPLAAFLAGAILSGVITGAVVSAQTDDQRVVTRTVTVPAPRTPSTTAPAAGGPAAAAAPCAETAKLARQQLDVVTDGIAQLSRLDTTGLQRSIDRMQRLQPQLEKAASACRAAAETP
jgi:hypothetical protein